MQNNSITVLETSVAAPRESAADIEIAQRISATYAEAKRTADRALRLVIACGALMLEQKEKCRHGQFGPWLEKNCPEISTKTAYQWMDLAKDFLALPEISPRVKFVDISLYKLLTAPSDDLSEPARAIQSDFLALLDGKTQKQITWGFTDLEPQKKKYNPRKLTATQLAVNERKAVDEIFEILTHNLTTITLDQLAIASDKVRVDLYQACLTLTTRMKNIVPSKMKLTA